MDHKHENQESHQELWKTVPGKGDMLQNNIERSDLMSNMSPNDDG